MYITICAIDRQSRFDTWDRVLRAGALGWPWGMEWGGRWEGGSEWGTCVSHGCTCVPHPEPPSHLRPHSIPQGHPSAPALSTLSHASNQDWWSVSQMIIYMFQCYSLKSSISPLPSPTESKVCSLHLCLFCCLAFKIIITVFLNSIYMQ